MPAPQPSNDTSLPLSQRIAQAQALWQRGLDAESRLQYPEAYRLHTQAHDLIIDCPQLHQQAHEQLRRVNWKLGHYGELVTDWALHLFAPLGVFEMVAYFAKQPGRLLAPCVRP